MKVRGIARAARAGGRSLRFPLPSGAAASSHDALPASASAGAAVSNRRHNSSFIKQVMEQVKRDMEADEKTKKDWEKAQESSQKISERADRTSEQLSEIGEKLRSKSAQTSEILSGWASKVQSTRDEVRASVDKATEDSENLKKAREFMRDTGGTVSSSSQVVFTKTREVFGGVMDRTSQALSYFGEDSGRNSRLKEWKLHRDMAAEAKAAKEAAAKAAEEEAAAAMDKATAEDVDGAAKAEATEAKTPPAPEPEPETGLVVSKVGNSSWERFGAGLRDSPFLSSVFENPLFEKMFGESEIAASIREMKEIDYGFQLEEFAEDIEYVVAPHIIKTYLEGDAEALEKHCGEAAFAAMNASIKARIQQKLTLDTNILAGPKEVELKGAKLMDKGPPCFIWTFNMQQVNCLRDKNDEIIEGAVDDIRTVFYAMVVQRHPKLEELTLEYPWQISELAIIGNQQCW